MVGERSALVMGATGFIGRHLVQTLRSDGWRAVELRRATSRGSAGQGAFGPETVGLLDARDLPDVLDATGVQYVFHLAAHQSRGHSHDDIDAFVEANLRLGMHLFAAAADRGICVVDALTFFQYRANAPAPLSLYSATKQAQAEFARFWRDCEGADIRDVVLFDNYGPGDTRDKLIPGLVQAVRSGEPLDIGPLEQQVDLLHVRDVVRGLVASAVGEPKGTLAVRASTFVSVATIVDLVGEIAGRPVPVRLDTARSVSDQPLVAGAWDSPEGWSPEVDLRVGLAECLEERP